MSPETQQAPASFEAALKELEDIVRQLESGEAKLEESLQLFERGVTLSTYCNRKLEEAEKKIELLVKDAQGEYRTKSFEPEKG